MHQITVNDRKKMNWSNREQSHLVDSGNLRWKKIKSPHRKQTHLVDSMNLFGKK